MPPSSDVDQPEITKEAPALTADDVLNRARRFAVQDLKTGLYNLRELEIALEGRHTHKCKMVRDALLRLAALPREIAARSPK